MSFHTLCCNGDLDETNSLNILRFMLNIDPILPTEVDVDNGYLPIHYATQYKSTAFCKELIDAYPESLRIELNGWLPINIDVNVVIEMMQLTQFNTCWRWILN